MTTMANEVTHPFDAFTYAFLDCALWSSTDNSRDDGGDPLDEHYDLTDIDEACVRALQKECIAFQEANAADLEGIDPEMAGHDFWLTRNRHGAGFWDRGHAQPVADRLTAASHVYGSVDLYVGDDGKVYASGYERGGK